MFSVLPALGSHNRQTRETFSPPSVSRDSLIQHSVVHSVSLSYQKPKYCKTQKPNWTDGSRDSGDCDPCFPCSVQCTILWDESAVQGDPHIAIQISAAALCITCLALQQRSVFPALQHNRLDWKEMKRVERRQAASRSPSEQTKCFCALTVPARLPVCILFILLQPTSRQY